VPGHSIPIEETNAMPAHPVAMTPRCEPRPAHDAASELLFPLLMTERGGRVSHYVTDDQVTAPVRGDDPLALCGTVFTPAALTTPPGPICPACLDRLRPPAHSGRPSRWRLRRQPAGPTSAITSSGHA
jgi:Protein of unknown function (DUF3039)